MLLCTLMTWEVWRALKRGFEKREWSFWLFKCRISSDFIGKMFCFFIVSIVKEKFCKPDSSYISLNCIFRPLNSQAFKLRFVLSVKGLEKACKWNILLCSVMLQSVGFKNGISQRASSSLIPQPTFHTIHRADRTKNVLKDHTDSIGDLVGSISSLRSKRSCSKLF